MLARTEAAFNQPTGVALSPSGQTLYVCDLENHAIREIDALTGWTRTVAGNGHAGYEDGARAVAQFCRPLGVAVGPDGTLYVADSGNNRIRMVNGRDGTTHTLAGSGTSEGRDGAGQYSSFNCPAALCYCAQPGHRYEGWLVVCEREAGRIRAVSVPKRGAPAAGEMPFVAQGKALGAA